jgi:hypothetical protein
LDTYTKITTAPPPGKPYIPAGKLVSCPENFKDVANLVDGNVTTIYYPERDYKRWHAHPNGVRVHGHSIAIAFRHAAWYVDSITSGDWVVGTASWPALTDALTDAT